MKRINWKKIWSDYDAWWGKQKPPRCKTCNQRMWDYPDWEDQKKKIQRLINKEINQFGFTLIELLCCLGIIGLLTVIAISSYAPVIDKFRGLW